MDGLKPAAFALLLLIVANSAPLLVRALLGRRLAAPMDFGWILPDGKRLLGDHKTWMGFCTGVLACGAAAKIMQVDYRIGAAFGALSLLGDAVTSSIKRRMGLKPGTEVYGLDQLPEALVPLVAFAPTFVLGPLDIAMVAIAFLTLDLLTLRWRQRQQSSQ